MEPLLGRWSAFLPHTTNPVDSASTQKSPDLLVGYSQVSSRVEISLFRFLVSWACRVS